VSSEEERKERAPKYGVTRSHFGGNMIEAIDHVSPYTIRNETGYVIEVEDDSEQPNASRYVI
jgi:hypothetical protein